VEHAATVAIAPFEESLEAVGKFKCSHHARRVTLRLISPRGLAVVSVRHVLTD
jgi:hypothetical protein